MLASQHFANLHRTILPLHDIFLQNNSFFMGDGYRETRAIILQRFDTFIPKRIEDFQKSIVPRNFNTFHITRIQIPSFTAIGLQQRRKAVRLY